MENFAKSENNHDSFGELLRNYRKKSKISQLDLALDIDISTKHLSFVETGRSNPSRSLVLKIASHLNLPYRQQNSLLLAAGYAPAFEELPFDGSKMKTVRNALHRLLDNHNPYPAFIVDPGYNILMTNSGYENFVKYYAGEEALKKYDNAMRIVFADDGLKPYIKDWSVIEQFLLMRLGEEAVSASNTQLAQMYKEFSKNRTSDDTIEFAFDMNLPVMTLVLEKEGKQSSFFTTIATLGTPLDLTTQEIRIELLFPSDEETINLIRSEDDLFC
jgi:transcriptional regulator with XRE-family HTH domain